jgi:hypothetical protein
MQAVAADRNRKDHPFSSHFSAGGMISQKMNNERANDQRLKGEQDCGPNRGQAL